jgi:hypothetical protein
MLTLRVLLSIDVPSIQVLKDGHQVSRISDFIIYSVEAEFISQVVSTYGPCEYDAQIKPGPDVELRTNR